MESNRGLLLLIWFVIVLHAVLTFTVVGCTFLSLLGILQKYKLLRNIYFVFSGAVLTSQFMYGECILTVVEKRLRNLYKPGSAYHTSFLAHYFPRVPDFVYNYVGPGLLVSGLVVQIVRVAMQFRGARPGPG